MRESESEPEQHWEENAAPHGALKKRKLLAGSQQGEKQVKGTHTTNALKWEKT